MDNETLLEIGKIGASVIIAVITTISTFKHNLNKVIETLESSREETAKELSAMNVKLDTLWDIYAKDAIKRAYDAGFVKKNSPEITTQKWLDTIGDELIADIVEYIEKQKNINVDSCSLHIHHFIEDLYLISIEKDSSLGALIGGFKVFCDTLGSNK